MSNKYHFKYNGSYKDEELLKNVYLPKLLKNTKITSKSKVLDIGCGFGYFLKICEEIIGCETYGVDISKDAIDVAKKITKAKLYVLDVDHGLSIFKDGYFDLVVMLDVIEHLKSPYSVLKEVYRVLKTGGYVVITTPNLNAIDRFLRKILRREESWHGFIDNTHLYLFTPKSLTFLISHVGFKIIKLDTPFHPLPRFLQVLLNKTGMGGQIWLIGKK